MTTPHEAAFLAILTEEQRASYEKLRDFRKGKQTFVNDYDKNASELIDFMYYLDQAQFARLPDIEAGTVFSIITRVLQEDHDSLLRTQDAINKRPSRAKSRHAEKNWAYYQHEFHEYLKKGKDVGWARNKIGDLIKDENKRRLNNGEKLIGVKGRDEKGQRNLRPSRKTLERQLVP